MNTIWRKDDEEWQRLIPSGFPSEEKLHDLVAEAPSLLPLSGDPTVVMLGREVGLGPGWADLIAVESDGRLVVIEIKLSRNSEAKRKVVAQVLTYAAYLKGIGVSDLDEILDKHLEAIDASSVVDAANAADESGDFDKELFQEVLSESLAKGAFRLVLVLDETPAELVQLVGYLESITSGIVIDLVSVASYMAGDEQILVPQRVDPEIEPEASPQPSKVQQKQKAKALRTVDGADAFEQSIEKAPEADRTALLELISWARDLESRDLARLKTVFGETRELLHVWVPGEKGGLTSIWNDNGVYISFWRSSFARWSPEHIEPIERIIGKPIGHGNTIRNPPPEVMDALAAAYEDVGNGKVDWNGRDFYFSFGQNEQRSWDEAAKFGFVSAGGGERYTNPLKSLKPGHRLYTYISKRGGVGGYVGVGEVTAERVPAKEFRVEVDGEMVSYLDVTQSPEASQFTDDPLMCEWVVPVKWIALRDQSDPVKDPQLFANQNIAVQMTNAYTLNRLPKEFGIEP